MTYLSGSRPSGLSQDLTAQLKAGWLNFGVANTEGALNSMRNSWEKADNDASALKSNLFFLGAVLSGDRGNR